MGNEAVTISSTVSSASSLAAINTGTSGNITLSDTSAALSGSGTDLQSGFSGTVTPYTGDVTVTSGVSVSMLKDINDAVSGEITLNDTSLILFGSSSDLVDAFAGTITTYTGGVIITDEPTGAQLSSINGAVSGDIQLNDSDGSISGSAASLVSAFAAVSYTHLTLPTTPYV